MLKIVALICLFIIAPARAQQAPAFAPFLVDEASFNSLRSYIGQLPFDQARPLINWLERSEITAQQAVAAAKAAEDEKKRKEEEK